MDRLEEIKEYLGWLPDNDLRRKFMSTTIPQGHLYWAVDEIDSLTKARDEVIGNFKRALRELSQVSSKKCKLMDENANLQQTLKDKVLLGLKQCGELAKAQREYIQLKAKLDASDKQLAQYEQQLGLGGFDNA